MTLILQIRNESVNNYYVFYKNKGTEFYESEPKEDKGKRTKVKERIMKKTDTRATMVCHVNNSVNLYAPLYLIMTIRRPLIISYRSAKAACIYCRTLLWFVLSAIYQRDVGR